MTWWCTASKAPWDWAPRAYPGIWIAMAALLAGYLAARRRAGGGGSGGSGANDRQLWAFLGGWAVLWAATDWPLGSLGAGYLASAHMGQYLLTTLVAAPLLVLGTPERVLRPALARARLDGLVRQACRPVAAGVIVNVVLVATHAPAAVDALRTSQVGSFALDAAWLVSGFVLWMPICGPLAELKPSYPVQGVFLFLAAGVVPMIPGGFLTFAATPLYATYELAPRVGGFDAVSDQQLAGALMKVGNIPLIWPVIATLFVRWGQSSRACPVNPVCASPSPDSSVPAGRPVEKRRTAHTPARPPPAAPWRCRPSADTVMCGDDEDAASGESGRRGVRHDSQDTP